MLFYLFFLNEITQYTTAIENSCLNHALNPCLISVLTQAPLSSPWSWEGAYKDILNLNSRDFINLCWTLLLKSTGYQWVALLQPLQEEHHEGWSSSRGYYKDNLLLRQERDFLEQNVLKKTGADLFHWIRAPSRLSKQGTVWFAGDSNKPPEKITAGQHRANTSRSVQRKAKPKAQLCFRLNKVFHF